MNKSSIVSKATWAKPRSKEENFRQEIKELKQTLHKLNNIQNEELNKLTDITQNLENNCMEYKKMVEYGSKLNQHEEEKEQLRNRIVQKTNQIVFQLDR